MTDFCRITVVAILMMLTGCNGERLKLDSQLSSRLTSSDRVELIFHGFNLPDGHSVTIVEKSDVQLIARELVQDRSWRAIEGALMSNRGVGIVFRDSEGTEVWRCKLVGKAIVCPWRNKKELVAEWPDGIDWIMRVAKVQDLASKAADSNADKSSNADDE